MSRGASNRRDNDELVELLLAMDEVDVAAYCEEVLRTVGMDSRANQQVLRDEYGFDPGVAFAAIRSREAASRARNNNTARR